MVFKKFPAVGVLGLLLIGSVYFTGVDGTHLNNTASASRHYGILGQSAPELNLSDWIDSRGKQTDPITLKSLQGRVVYLYFFQDW